MVSVEIKCQISVCLENKWILSLSLSLSLYIYIYIYIYIGLHHQSTMVIINLKYSVYKLAYKV